MKNAPCARASTSQIAQGALELAHALRIPDEARGFWKENNFGDPLGADMSRQHNPVSASMQKLALGGDRIAAGKNFDAHRQAPDCRSYALLRNSLKR